jgi:uroporphyrin-III C-methyltransferase/precorrin-2 dehydrogenase/sirohydrochlorin ferrochelatase
MDFLPLFYQLKGKPCLIIGGGAVALRKARLLTRAHAVVTVVAPQIQTELQDLCSNFAGSAFEKSYSESDLDACFLVVAATNDQALNQQISADCHARHIPVNVVDQPELCSFIFPAIIDRSPLIAAVSSGGASPVLARLLRSRIESVIPAAYGKLASLLGGFRERVKTSIPDLDHRRDFWEQIIHGPVSELMLSGRENKASDLLEQSLNDFDDTQSRGEVFLIGAGPGDPDLLTFKALRLMQKADVVLYDRLVAQPILDLVRKDAELVYVGKARAEHTMPQQDINELLVHYAQQDKKVARLKGGDPFIFGRGGEEIERLAEQDIPFQIVPGITAASGCASYAGIPLTHRDHAQSVRFITGHLKDNSIDLPWNELVQPNQTLVFYMGLVGLPVICEQLIKHGRSAETPIALIEQGTTEKQRVIVENLKNMPATVDKMQVKAPTLLIVGEVVSLRDKLAWY